MLTSKKRLLSETYREIKPAETALRCVPKISGVNSPHQNYDKLP